MANSLKSDGLALINSITLNTQAVHHGYQLIVDDLLHDSLFKRLFYAFVQFSLIFLLSSFSFVHEITGNRIFVGLTFTLLITLGCFIRITTIPLEFRAVSLISVIRILFGIFIVAF
jgi:hypothetical protein